MSIWVRWLGAVLGLSLTWTGALAHAVEHPAAVLQKALANPTSVTTLDLRGCDRPEAGSDFDPEKAKPCTLTELPANIGMLTNLRELDLSGNHLRALPKALFSLPKLERLDLSYNHLASLPDELGALTSLVELSLRHNPLPTLPASIGALTLLKRLVLAQTFVTDLPAALSGLANLETLDLYATNITAFPEVTAKLAKLTLLDLSGTRLSSQYTFSRVKQYPPALATLKINHVPLACAWLAALARAPALREVEVRYSRCDDSDVEPLAKTLPRMRVHANIRDNMYVLTTEQLQRPETVLVLHLYTGGHHTLPAEVSQFVNLRRLDASSINTGGKVPAAIFGLKKLEELALSSLSPELTEAPAELVQLPRLRELQLDGNKLSRFPTELLDLPNLEFLDISGNPIDTFPSDPATLHKLARLKVLHVATVLYRARTFEQKYADFFARLPIEVVRRWTHPYYAHPRDWFTDAFLHDACDSLRRGGKDAAWAEGLLGPGVVPRDPNETLQRALAHPGEVTALDLRGVAEPFSKLQRKGCMLRGVPREIGALKKLVELNLRQNDLYELPEEMSALRALKKLDLSYNELNAIPKSLYPLGALEDLSLYKNPIKELPADIGKLRRLKRLNLGQTPIKKLPEELALLGDLEEFEAYATDVVEFPLMLAHLPRLRVLGLLGAHLWNFPEAPDLAHDPASYFPALEVLSIEDAGNFARWIAGAHITKDKSLETPFAAFVSLKRIEVFDRVNPNDDLVISTHLPQATIVGGWSCTLIPGDLRNPERHKGLNLEQKCTEPPPVLAEFVNLRQLVLEGNGLRELPPVVLALKHLTSLLMAGNALRELPPELVELQELQYLELGGNALRALPEVVLKLPRFRGLEVPGNNISRLPRDIGPYAKLRDLDLVGNRLTRAEMGALKRDLPWGCTIGWSWSGEDYGLPATTWEQAKAEPARVLILDLTGEGLTKLPAGLGRLRNLEVLRLDDNPISELPVALRKLKSLQVIYAQGTLLDADDAKKLKKLLPRARLLLGEP